MPPDHQTHRHRRRIARYYLAALFVALRMADALLLVYAFDDVNPWPFLRGQVAGIALATTLLMLGIWRRQMWARYSLIFVMWYQVVLFSICLLIAIQEPQLMFRRPIAAGLAGVFIYIVSNIVIIRSRKIQALAHSGGIER